MERRLNLSPYPKHTAIGWILEMMTHGSAAASWMSYNALLSAKRLKSEEPEETWYIDTIVAGTMYLSSKEQRSCVQVDQAVEELKVHSGEKQNQGVHYDIPYVGSASWPR